MNFIELKVNIRKTTGSNSARAMRAAGKIPAVLYASTGDPILLSLDGKEFEQSLKDKKSHSLYNLAIENGVATNKTVMIKELQVGPMTRMLLHVDFYEIVMDRKIKVKVPVVVTGKSEGVESGGILQIIRRELEILCFPNEIPEKIEIDVTDLDIGGSIHVKDISLDENIEIQTDVNFTIITVVGARLDEELEKEVEEEIEGEEETEEKESDSGSKGDE